MSENELKELKKEQEFWNKLEKPLGWILSGWSGMNSATYYTSKHTSLCMTRNEVDTILKAIKEK